MLQEEVSCEESVPNIEVCWVVVEKRGALRILCMKVTGCQIWADTIVL